VRKYQELTWNMIELDSGRIHVRRAEIGHPFRRHRARKRRRRGRRLRGSRNRLSEAVISALLRDFSKHGEKAIAKARQTQPAAYLKILALLVPREHKVEHSNPLKAMSDEELEQALAALRDLLARRAAAAAKVIDGEVASPLLPAPQKHKSNRLMREADTAVGPRKRKPRMRKVRSPAST
jgi:hypothetical protein